MLCALISVTALSRARGQPRSWRQSRWGRPSVCVAHSWRWDPLTASGRWAASRRSALITVLCGCTLSFCDLHQCVLTHILMCFCRFWSMFCHHVITWVTACPAADCILSSKTTPCWWTVSSPSFTPASSAVHLKVFSNIMYSVYQGFSKSAFKGPNMNYHQCQRSGRINWLLNLFLINMPAGGAVVAGDIVVSR